MAPRNPPAAGASGGRAPLPATFFVSEFIRFDKFENKVLCHDLTDPLCTHLYWLIVGHSVFETGEFLGGYARLMELSTPPQPERGPRRKGPSMWQMRRAIDDLERSGLVRRSPKNEEQGQLRLWVHKRKSKATPTLKPRR